VRRLAELNWRGFRGITAIRKRSNRATENVMAKVGTSLIAAFLAAAAVSTMARAQDFKPDPVDEAAARREGALTWYTSTPVAAAQHIAKTFEQKYGIKVELLRTGGQNVIRRFQQEADAGRIAVDMITMSDMSAANAMTRKGLFVPFKPVGFDKVIPDAKHKDGFYIAQRLNLVGMLVRTDKIAAADYPRIGPT
jgi:iron(III) transport system substrate-binding protein